MLSVEILGELRLSVDGTPIELRGLQRRRVIALLCAHAPAPVSAAQLAECLDPGARSANPANAVQAHIRRLRSAIEPGVPGAASQHLPATGDGYALVPDHMDLWDVRRLVDQARARRDDDPCGAASTLATVLDRWRTPWGALGDEPVLSHHRWSLEVQRLGIEDEWAAMVVQAGVDAATCERLVELARAEPSREGRVAHAMRSLFQVGRQVEALRLFDEVRDDLLETLGVSPGPELEEMHLRVLRHDPSLRARSPQILGLPRRVRSDPLVGRAAQLDSLGRLASRHRIVTVVGATGVGTTRLVEHWLTDDGATRSAIWIDVLTATDGLDAALGDALGVGDSPEVDGRLDPALRALPDGPIVVVIDGAERRPDQVGDLVLALVAARPSLHVVITSKAPLDLPGEQILVVPPLPVDDDGGSDGAVRLAVDRLGPGVPHELAVRTARLAAGVPLAIELEAGAIRDGSSGVAADDPTERSTMPVVAAWETLDDIVHAAVLRVSPAARSVLGLASALPDGVGVEATRWRCDQRRDPTVSDPHEHRRLLGELVRAQLVELRHDPRGVRYVALAQVAPAIGATVSSAAARAAADANVEWICHLAGPGLDPPLVPDDERRRLLVAEARNVSAALATLRDGDPAHRLEVLVALVPQLGRLPERSRLRREIERFRAEGPGPLEDARLVVADAIMLPDMAAVAGRRAELNVALRMIDRDDVAPEWVIGARVLNAIAAGWSGDVDGAVAHLDVARHRAMHVASDWSRAVVDRYRSVLALVLGDPDDAVRIAVDAADRLVVVGDPIEALGALHFAVTASWSAVDADTAELLERAEHLAGTSRSVFEPLLRAERARFALSTGAPDSGELLAAAAASLESAGMLRTAAMTRRRLGLLHLSEGRRDAAFEQLLGSADALVVLDPAGAALAIAGLVRTLDDPTDRGPRDLLQRLTQVALALTSARGTPLTDDERVDLDRLVERRSVPPGLAPDPVGDEVLADAASLLASVRR